MGSFGFRVVAGWAICWGMSDVLMPVEWVGFALVMQLRGLGVGGSGGGATSAQSRI